MQSVKRRKKEKTKMEKGVGGYKLFEGQRWDVSVDKIYRDVNYHWSQISLLLVI